MPTRNCETRPISWKTHRNRALADAVIKMGEHYGDFRKGFVVWPVWMGLLTHRDNVGYFDGAAGILRDSFFPHFTGEGGSPEVTPDEVKIAREILAEVGLIITYKVNGIDYILVPKVSNWSRLVGNISDKTDCPLPPPEIIKSWEERFNEVYTPLIRCTNAVRTPYEHRTNGVPTESKRESKIEINTYIQDFFAYFLLKTKKSLKLTPERKAIIEKRIMEGRTLEELKKAVDNFVSDEWEGRKSYIDIVYCIGVHNKVDNLDKWLNFKPKPGKPIPQAKKDCDVCGGTGKVKSGSMKGAQCFCVT
jgi:uncharacterized phage protein (TIGR02220 family)